ncbi:MAG: leucine-rich repeat protein, partial [Kiritimatiellae bacterium]|nr:leucine-rich repeat protein [Kiritimatiellia bacterium]
LASDGMHAISANTEGCVYVPDGSCLWTGREPVTCIGRNAFKNCDKITRVTLPATITDIGENAFDGCTALKAVVIPSSDILEHINTNAFAGATSLEHIYVGKGDKVAFTALLEASGYTVPNENFILECDFYKLTLDTNLGDELDMPVLTKAYTETIYLPNVGNLPVPTRNRYTFDGWYTEKFGGIRINADDTLSGGDWTLYAHWTTDLPDPVFSIANDFNGRPVLESVALNRNTEVTLPDGVEVIAGPARTSNGGYLFTNSYDRSIIQRVTMPDSVKRIRLMAFADCPNLSEVYLSNALTNIGLSAFEHCGSLKSIDIPGTVDVIDRYAFFGCSNMVDLVIGNGVREIGDGAFYNCRSLVGDGENGLVIPDSVKTIGNAAFMYAGMRKLSIPKGATIEPWAFSYCKNLESVNIGGVVVSPTKKLLARNRLLAAASSNPDAITIGKNAFSGNKALTSAVIGSTVEEIGGGAFAGCENLATITIQGNDNYTDLAGLILTKDGTTLVSAYGSNTSATVPAGVTTIAEFAFAGDESVTNAVLPSGVTTIGEAAFSNATQFAAITIPSTITSIGANAFCDTVLATVYVSKGDTARVSGLIVASGRSVSGVEFVEMEDALEPSIPGDSGATVTGDATSGYEVVPSTTSGTVEVEVPAGLDANKVTVVVPPTASVKPNGANVKVVKTVDATSYDITGFLDLPAAVEGVIDLNNAVVKEAIVKEALDPTKEGVDIDLNPSAPEITTAATRPGLTYTFSEGTTLEGMTQKATKVGDGTTWTPTITVKGGTSGFYSIGVTK